MAETWANKKRRERRVKRKNRDKSKNPKKRK
jgi:hypothetical protein